MRQLNSDNQKLAEAIVTSGKYRDFFFQGVNRLFLSDLLDVIQKSGGGTFGEVEWLLTNASLDELQLCLIDHDKQSSIFCREDYSELFSIVKDEVLYSLKKHSNLFDLQIDQIYQKIIH